MALKIDAKFERKLICAIKNDMRSFANFHGLKNSREIFNTRPFHLSREIFNTLLRETCNNNGFR